MCSITDLPNSNKRKALRHDNDDEIQTNSGNNKNNNNEQRSFRKMTTDVNKRRTRRRITPDGKEEEKCIIFHDDLSNNSIDLNIFASSVCLRKTGKNVQLRSYDSFDDDFFLLPTQEEIKMYDQDVLTAVRKGDLDTLRSFHKQGRTLKCSNKFGESLLHMACRKGMIDVVDFFINQAGVPLSVRDDVGRSPLHDACWTSTPNFPIVRLILQKCPDLLYICDRRGHTPLSYVRRDQWIEWKSFLLLNSDLITPNIKEFDKKLNGITNKE